MKDLQRRRYQSRPPQMRRHFVSYTKGIQWPWWENTYKRVFCQIRIALDFAKNLQTPYLVQVGATHFQTWLLEDDFVEGMKLCCL